MNAEISQHPRNQPVWSSVAMWLALFLSPTAYFLLLVVWSRLQMPAPPAGFVVALFCLIPAAALLICGSLVWRTKWRADWRVGWLVLTVLAMALQLGVLLLIIVSAITVAISLP